MWHPRPVEEVVETVIDAAEAAGEFGVPGLVRFTYVERTAAALTVMRRNGNTVRIPKTTLAAALEGVRGNHGLYIDGPGSLRDVGITHITSPTYALLRLLPLNELIE